LHWAEVRPFTLQRMYAMGTGVRGRLVPEILAKSSGWNYPGHTLFISRSICAPMKFSDWQ
jgi:hypothetical protein